MSKDLIAVEQMYLSGITLRKIASTEAAGGLNFRTIQKLAVKLGWRDKLMNSDVAPKPLHGNTGYLSAKKRKLADSYRVWFSVERHGTKINNVIKPGWTPYAPPPYRSKNEAIAAGARYFFTGDACQNGHYANRDVKAANKGGLCFACLSSKRKHQITDVIEFPVEAEQLRCKRQADWESSVPHGLSPYRTKEDAKINNSPTYFTGVACVRGHISNKSTATGNCLECKRNDELKRKSALTKDERDSAWRREKVAKRSKRRKAYLDLVTATPGAVPYKTKKEAKEAGSRVYFLGKPCDKGHLANKQVNTGECVDCADMRRDAYEGSLYKLWFDKEMAFQKKISEAGKEVSSFRNRANAVVMGSDRYFTGIECCNGHLDDHIVSRGNQCASCLEIADSYSSYEHRLKAEDPIKYAARKRSKRHRRRATEKNAIGKFSQAEFISVVDGQNGKCFWCGEDVDGSLHADHYIPLSGGGTNWITNIVASCPKCNLAKSDTAPHEFATEIGRTDIAPDMFAPRSDGIYLN